MRRKSTASAFLAPPGAAALAAAVLLVCPALALADTTMPARRGEDGADDAWNWHAQFTNVSQWHPDFKAPYSGGNSLDPREGIAATNDATLFVGVRPWNGGEFWINAEYDQGAGLSNTLGVGGYPSGEAYKVGANTPYPRLPRAFFRQTFDLGGSRAAVEPAINQFGGTQTADKLVITIGKFSVTDVFDTNAYAHDPRSDFLNWSVVDAGAFDYAADAWGFTDGVAMEWSRRAWTLRGGFFALSKVPNGTVPDVSFKQHEAALELESRHWWGNHAGRIRLLAFENRGRMGSYLEAIAQARQSGTLPDTAAVRHFTSRRGVALGIEQELAPDLGFFARASINDGGKEAYEFTDINRSISAGLSLRGDHWGYHGDTAGIAAVANALSGAARAYFATGGMGLLIGDGRQNYGREKILEAYYAHALNSHLTLGLDYQFIANPAYNRDRGPLPVVAARVHAEY